MQICSRTQVGLKFPFIYCDKTSLRKYRPAFNSFPTCYEFTLDQNRFVPMTETCKTKLVNKILKILEESHDQPHHHKLSSQKSCAFRELALHSLGKWAH